MTSLLFKWAGRCAPLVLLAACMGDVGPVSDTELAGQDDALSVVVGPTLLPKVFEFVDPLGVEGAEMREQTLLVTSAREYEAKFGHPPPAGIKLEGGNVVVFYSAGPKRTGGYDASFTYVRPYTLPGTPTPLATPGPDALVGTLLTAPGADCQVSQGVTTPYVLGLIPRAHYDAVDFRGVEQKVDCSICDADCDDGEHCELEERVCVTESCSPRSSVCVPDELDPCATVQCVPPTRCVADGDRPVCKPIMPVPRPLPL